MSSAIAEIRSSLAPQLERLNLLIAESLHTSNPLMNHVIEGYLEHKGKQLRPMLVLLTYRLAGGRGDNVLPAAAAVEILHNASLIHDDVVDDSATRHGHPTINAVWDNHIAVLVGDYFVSTALELSLRTDSRQVVSTIARLGRLLSLGEMDQIYNARFHTLAEEAYFNVISHKTASLFVACVEMGAWCVGSVSHEQLEALREFAELFGRCFQIKDDIFDYYESDKIGKPTGNDLREGKVTLPLLYALTSSDHPDRDTMAELVRKDILDDSEIESLMEFAKEAGGVEYAESKLRRLRDEAASVLKVFPPSDASDELLALLDFVISRES